MCDFFGFCVCFCMFGCMGIVYCWLLDFLVFLSVSLCVFVFVCFFFLVSGDHREFHSFSARLSVCLCVCMCVSVSVSVCVCVCGCVGERV